MSTGDWFGNFALYGVGGALVLWILWAWLQHDLAQRRALSELIAGGFKVDHQVNSTKTVVFDDTLREMVIIAGPTLYRYSYSQVDTWSHECLVRNGAQTGHKLVFTVLDPKHPRHEIRVSGREAKLWIAKMRAILAQ
ncbi:hypothetical protein [Pseudoduganella sp.]|uniref:hypothetical protein n=1 Tax=Pseudoduganella sp. TaxID=1880898 RepID=UPI0035B167E3